MNIIFQPAHDENRYIFEEETQKSVAYITTRVPITDNKILFEKIDVVRKNGPFLIVSDLLESTTGTRIRKRTFFCTRFGLELSKVDIYTLNGTNIWTLYSPRMNFPDWMEYFCILCHTNCSTLWNLRSWEVNSNTKNILDDIQKLFAAFQYFSKIVILLKSHFLLKWSVIVWSTFYSSYVARWKLITPHFYTATRFPVTTFVD